MCYEECQMRRYQRKRRRGRQSRKTHVIEILQCKLKPEWPVKVGLYRIWCGVNRLDVSGVLTHGDTSAFVNPAGQLLLTRRNPAG